MSADDPKTTPIWDPRRVSARRSFLLLGLGAVAGLVIAGVGLFTAGGGAPRTVPPEMVALVNAKPILRSDFDAQVEALYGVPVARSTPEQRRKVLDDMIREELFVQRGLELDFPGTDADTRASLVAAVEAQGSAGVTAREPTPAELRAWYDSHRQDYVADGVIALDEILVPPAAGGGRDAARALALEAARLLKQGAPSSAVAARLGQGVRALKRVEGEEFNFAAAAHLGAPLFAVASRLPAGGVSDPVEQADGFHVLKINKTVPSVPQSFEEARERVAGDYRKAEQARLQAAGYDFLRSKAQVLVQPELR